MSINKKLSTIVCFFCMSGLVLAQDENPAESCKEAASLYEAGQLDDAIEEVRWCLEVMVQQKQQQAVSVFPDEVNGYVGGEVENQNVMGMNMIERNYTREGESIQVVLTNGSGGAAAGFAALAQMGISLGGNGGKKFRVQRRTVMDVSNERMSKFIVTLKSGGSLVIESSTASYDDALAFIKAYPVAKIDDAFTK